jgi:S-methylmethionine-dependent homocysteine/selenocysteine methylase
MASLRELIDSGRTIILDAAMGTDLQARGCDISTQLWSAKPLTDRPDVVRHIHIDNIDCGADIITANTFRTQKRTFEKAGYNYNGLGFEDTAKELTTTAVDLAKDAVMIAAAEEEEVLIAGCAAPLEDSYKPEMTPDTAALEAEHYAHIKNLVDAGSDFILAETLTNIAEITAVLKQMSKFEIDYIISITPRNDRELLSGESIADAVNVINNYAPAAILVNCIHPSLVEPVLTHMKTLTERPLGAYANVGDPNYKDGEAMKQTVSPDEYFNYAKKWKALGARIIGGCCGTNPLYIRKLSLLKSDKK